MTARRRLVLLLWRRTAFRLVVLLLAVGVALDLSVGSVSDWFNGHQLTTAVGVELLLLAGIYFGLDFVIEQAEGRRWALAATEAMGSIAIHVIQMNSQIQIGLASRASNPAAQRPFNDLTNAVDTYQSLLTASAHMVEYLPSTMTLLRTAGDLITALDRGAVWIGTNAFADVVGKYDESIVASARNTQR